VRLELSDGPLLSRDERIELTRIVAARVGGAAVDEGQAPAVDAWQAPAGQGCIAWPAAVDDIVVTADVRRDEDGLLQVRVGTGGLVAPLPPAAGAPELLAAARRLRPTEQVSRTFVSMIGGPGGGMVAIWRRASRGPWQAEDLAWLDALELADCRDGRDWAHPERMLLEVDQAGLVTVCRTEEPWGPPARGAGCVCDAISRHRFTRVVSNHPRLLRFSTSHGGDAVRLQLDDALPPALRDVGTGVDKNALQPCLAGLARTTVTWSLDAAGQVQGVTLDPPNACAHDTLRHARFACLPTMPATVRGTFHVVGQP
jgi:hypothetical protein